MRIWIGGILAGTLLSACQHSVPRYLISQGLEQSKLFAKARPIPEVLKDPKISEDEKRHLKLVGEVLEFARSEYGFRTKDSYKKYLKLERPWVTKIVVAAYQDRLEPYLFKFPLFGALPYRGYFNEAKASDFANHLSKSEDLDIMIRSVPAYSSTGWFADPVISTMFGKSEIDFVELLFHELVHLQFYFKGKADFNEAFATWFAERATQVFIQRRSDLFPEAQKSMELLERSQLRQQRFSELIANWTLKAKEFYQSKRSEAERKDFFEKLHLALIEYNPKAKWPQYPELNNAFLISSSTYYLMLPKIEAYAKMEKLDEGETIKRVQKIGSKITEEIQN